MSAFQDREDFVRRYIDLMLLLDAVDFHSEVVVFADLEDESGRNFSSAFPAREYVTSEDGKAWASIFRRAYLASWLTIAWPSAKATIAELQADYSDDPREWVFAISAKGCQLRGAKVAGVKE